jgi:phage-related minor tail protein
VASDTSLVFNLVARDRASETLGRMKEKFGTAATAVSAGVAAAFGAGVAGALDLSAAGSKLQAQLGITPAKANELSKTAAKIYAQNWGESVGQVDEAIKGVYQQIGDVSKVKGGLQGVTTSVLALSQTFDQDLGGVTNAVGQMIKTGLAKDAGQALDILTKGFQSGADKAGDLLDTMNEYGTQFRKLGIDGQTATGLLSQGLKGGARDADLVADAIKEFSIRAVDGSTTTAQGFKMIGLNAKSMSEQIGKGGASARQGLDTVLDRLRAIKDPVKQAQAAVNLFGTQSEDLGRALYSIDPSTAVQSLGKVEGAANQMANAVGNNPSAALETFKRQAQMKLAAVTGNMIQFAMQNASVVKPQAASLGTIALVILAIRAGQIAWTAATTAWTAVTTLATAVQWAYNAALAASPTTWIIIGIVALIAVIVLIATKTTWFQQLWHAAWGAITGAAAATWNWMKRTWPGVETVLTKPFTSSYQWITRQWNAMVGFVAKLPGRIGKASSGMWDGIKDAFRSSINWIIGGWNSLRFTIPGVDTHIPGVGSIGGVSFGVPAIPYLAKGGTITAGGMAVVGDAGPEAVYLPRGATVAPLTRTAGGGVVRVVIDLPGESDLLRANRKAVRVYGRGNVQVAFGTGS